MASQTGNSDVLEDGKRELHANMEDANNGVVVVAQSGSFQSLKTEPTKLQDGEGGEKIEDDEQVTINSIKLEGEDGPSSLKSSCFEDSLGDGKHANINHGGIVAEVTGLSTDSGKQHMANENNELEEDLGQRDAVQAVANDCQDSFDPSNGLNMQQNDMADNEIEGLAKDDDGDMATGEDSIQIAVSPDLSEPNSQQINEEIPELAPPDQALHGKAEDAGKDIEVTESEEASAMIIEIDEKSDELQSTVQVSDAVVVAEALVDGSELTEDAEETVAVKNLSGTEQENPESTGDDKGFDIVIMEEIKGEERQSMNESTEINEGEMKEKVVSNAEYLCEECGKSFTHLSSKKRHMLKHTEIDSQTYKCLACSKTFQYNSSLKRHLKLHSEEPTGKAYTCKECSKAFMYATSLKRHLKTHAGKEIYPCPHCQRCFEYISSLKRHEKLHTEGKGFKCNVCSKSFGYLSSLTRHNRVHQKTLKCDKCSKVFRLYKSLAKHYVEHGVPVREDDLAAMAVEGEAEDDGDSNMDVDEANGEESVKAKKDGKESETLEEDNVRASMAVNNETTESQVNAIDGDVIDLQSAENHPFVKFVVSQNTLTLEQFQSFQQAQGMSSSDAETNQEVAFAVVQPDGGTILNENCTMVTEGVQECTGTPVGGIVFVEVDQNNKVTERHMEGLQASNLLQLLQAVEGFATENVVEGEEKAQESEEKKGMEVAEEAKEEQAKEEQPELPVETDKEETVT